MLHFSGEFDDFRRFLNLRFIFTLSPGANGWNHDAALVVLVGGDDAVVHAAVVGAPSIADGGAVHVGFDGPLRQDCDGVNDRVLRMRIGS